MYPAKYFLVSVVIDDEAEYSGRGKRKRAVVCVFGFVDFDVRNW
jgi:hypothetical protein